MRAILLRGAEHARNSEKLGEKISQYFSIQEEPIDYRLDSDSSIHKVIFAPLDQLRKKFSQQQGRINLGNTLPFDQPNTTLVAYAEDGELENLSSTELAICPIIPATSHLSYINRICESVTANDTHQTYRRFIRLPKRSQLVLSGTNNGSFMSTEIVDLGQAGMGIWSRPGFAISEENTYYDFELNTKSLPISGTLRLRWSQNQGRISHLGSSFESLQTGHLKRLFVHLTQSDDPG